VVNNFRPTFPADRSTYIPSIKIDHNLSNRTKISGSYQRTDTLSLVSTQFSQADGIPGPATEARTTDIVSHVTRINFEHSLSPTVLFHFGAGYLQNNLLSATAINDFDQVSQLGLRGATAQGKFPTLLGLTAARGGVKNLGVSGNQDRTIEIKPTANTNLTLVRNNHTYKFGGEMVLEGMVGKAGTRTNGRYTFGAAQTALPYLEATSVGGRTIGFPYASFLLGLVDSGDISPPINQRLGKSLWGFYAQDSWKATRTLTIDYGLRWDYFTYLKEHHGRAPQLSPTTPNPAAGAILGASIFEGSGPGRCNCDFAKNYPWSFGPRLGVAWQASAGWVVRTGFGISYSGTDDTRTIDFGNQNPFAACLRRRGHAAAGRHTGANSGKRRMAQVRSRDVPHRRQPHRRRRPGLVRSKCRAPRTHLPVERRDPTRIGAGPGSRSFLCRQSHGVAGGRRDADHQPQCAIAGTAGRVWAQPR
jgi:hypothetical protein